MPAEYHNITRDEMEALLVKQWGFHRMNMREIDPSDNTVELVYGKVATIHGHKVSCRIYTAINPDGNSRAIGEDAIRIKLYVMQNGTARQVNKTRRCLRVKNWAENIRKALADEKTKVQKCPGCGALMAWRKKQKFFGCVTFHDTGCKGRPQ